MGATATAPVEGTALVPTSGAASQTAVRMLRPVAAPAAMIAQQNEMRAFVKEVLQKGRDYGNIPGIDKPTLLKPGAEKVVLGFGCASTAAIVEREIDHDRRFPWVKRKAKWASTGPGQPRQKVGEETVEGESLGLYRYVVRVDVVDQDGAIRGSGLGSCSSMESKYIDRPRDSENTILKMATKRALIAATLGTFGLSDEFTQDVEDMPHVQRGAGEGGGGGNGRDPRETILKFGFAGVKGKPLGELKDEQLRNAIEWAEKNGKFPEIVADCRAVLKLREDEVRAAATRGSAEQSEQPKADGASGAKPPRTEGFEEFPPAPVDDDDLPY